jgi:succinate dehydrogenase hydrophobic anchor subunit
MNRQTRDGASQERGTRHVWDFGETLLGPAIYLVFFGLTYLAGSLACALSRGNMPVLPDAQTAMSIAVAAFTLVALALIGWHMTAGLRLLAKGRKDREEAFLGFVTLTLAALSAIAVVWTALPAAMVPATCS